jgi:probable HAF family extracellular repeat protein
MKRSLETFGTAAFILALACVPARAQVSFQPFPVTELPIDGMSADGSVIVGTRFAVTAFRWTATGGVEDIGGDMDVVAISRDGKTIVGRARDANGVLQAAIWQGGRNWRLLGGVPNGVPDERSVLSSATAVSADGSVVTGIAYIRVEGATRPRAFRWDAANGMVDLGALLGRESTARAVSADGNTVVGYDDDRGNPTSQSGRAGVIFWRGVERLLHPFGWAGEARAVNNDGSIIVGQWHPVPGTFLPDGSFLRYRGRTTYMYTAWDGRFEDLGAVRKTELGPIEALNEYLSNPRAVSDDGSVVGGGIRHFCRRDGVHLDAGNRNDSRERISDCPRRDGTQRLDADPDQLRKPGWQAHRRKRI